ncbi:MAG: hypothetical protein R2848_07040 [Thermomicrobiales bacterium]
MASLYRSTRRLAETLIELAQDMASRQYSSLDKATARALLDRLFLPTGRRRPRIARSTSHLPWSFSNPELAKLALASYPGPITVGIIDEMIPQRSEERIFPLLDAVIGGNQRGALGEVENARRAGEDPSRDVGADLSADGTGGSGEGCRSTQRPGTSRPRAWTCQCKPHATGGTSRAAGAHGAGSAAEAGARERSTNQDGRIRNPEEGLLDLVVRVTGQTENR